MDKIIIKRLELGPMANFTYLLGDPVSKTCAVIDPGWEAGEIIKEADALGLEITHILLTHTHFDHARAADTLAKKTRAKIYVHAKEAGVFEKGARAEISDGEKIDIGDMRVKVVATPGHSPGSVCFLAGDVIFTGDTLFVDGIGRTDLEGGSEGEMIESLKLLSRFPDNMIVYPGHGYGAEPASTVGEQKRRNPYLKF
jgi:glyoxylase-like metal-dependent hydrolase (beta-lactamase superfamily II)